MALVKNPLMSVDARGSVAGITFTKTFAGPVAKAKPIPTASIRGWRPTIRSIMGYLSRKWSTLSDIERQAWRDWASTHPGTNKFGDPFIMSGANAYVMLNSHALRLFTTGSDNDLPPELPPVSNIEWLIATTGAGVAGDIDLAWSELGVGIAADKWEVQIAGPFQSQGRVEVKSRFHYVARQAGNVMAYTAPGLTEGFWYWFRVRYVAKDGQTTAWGYSQATPKLTV